MSDEQRNLPAAANRDERGRYLKGHALGGNPVKLTDELIDALGEVIAQGNSLERAVDKLKAQGWENVPSAHTLYHWHSGTSERDEELSARLRQVCDLARERWADRLADDYESEVTGATHNKDEAAWLRELGGMVRWKTAMLARHRYGRQVGDTGDIALNVGVQILMPDNGRKQDSD